LERSSPLYPTPTKYRQFYRVVSGVDYRVRGYAIAERNYWPRTTYSARPLSSGTQTPATPRPTRRSGSSGRSAGSSSPPGTVPSRRSRESRTTRRPRSGSPLRPAGRQGPHLRQVGSDRHLCPRSLGSTRAGWVTREAARHGKFDLRALSV
jgi:hypothetical protein